MAADTEIDNLFGNNAYIPNYLNKSGSKIDFDGFNGTILVNLNEVLLEIKIDQSERDVVNGDDMTMPWTSWKNALIAQFTSYLSRVLCFC